MTTSVNTKLGSFGNEVIAEIDPLTGMITGLLINDVTAYKSRAPNDTLDSPVVTGAVSTAAVSTTAAITVAGGTGHKARIVSRNNGAAGTELLYISVNALNAVEGLAASQNSLRRDATITIGDEVVLISDAVITRVDVSASAPITSGTHSLQVTFGD